MPDYRAYILDREGKIRRFKPLICPDDDAAVVAAKQLVDGCDVELWQRGRKVVRLAHKAGSD
jgi:hypothetical protein